jgi:hypothetical protein
VSEGSGVFYCLRCARAIGVRLDSKRMHLHPAPQQRIRRRIAVIANG